MTDILKVLDRMSDMLVELDQRLGSIESRLAQVDSRTQGDILVGGPQQVEPTLIPGGPFWDIPRENPDAEDPDAVETRDGYTAFSVETPEVPHPSFSGAYYSKILESFC